MNRKLLLLVMFCCLQLCILVPAQSPAPRMLHKDPVMTRHAEGTFDVKTTPLPADETLMGTLIGRYSLVKQYHGDLDAASKGEMLAAGESGEVDAALHDARQQVGVLHLRVDGVEDAPAGDFGP